jgi:hypothetical protein
MGTGTSWGTYWAEPECVHRWKVWTYTEHQSFFGESSVKRDNPFAHCTQFLARSRLDPFECPNSPPAAAQTVDIPPFGDTTLRQDGHPRNCLRFAPGSSLSTTNRYPAAFLRRGIILLIQEKTFGVWYKMPPFPRVISVEGCLSSGSRRTRDRRW